MMKNQNFNVTIEAHQPREKVFDAINNVRGWWSENIEGKTDKVNQEFTHRDKYLSVTFKITKLTPQEIVWEVISSHCNMFIEKMHEWEHTRIVFEITEKAGKTNVKFTHQGLVPQFECYSVCAKAWNFFIKSSLDSLIQTGEGAPISDEYASFTTSIMIDKSPEEVYESIKNVRGWWLHHIVGDTKQLDDEFKFYTGGRLQFHFKIIEMITNKRIVWRVLEQHFRNTEKQEWKGTTVLFEISRKKSGTELRFTHQGLIPALECYSGCQSAWTNYIQISLSQLVENGTGSPNKW